MSSEIFAEDIESLLERLDGISSARVVANDSGEIERIYVTASSERDEAPLRRSVSSALMSRYSLAVDGWRIRVARLRADDSASSETQWRLVRLDEVLDAASARVILELQTEHGDGWRLVGRAQGPTDTASRRRTAAHATLAALKSVLDAEGRKATVETIASAPLPAGEAMVVAVSIAASARADLYVGVAVARGNDAEAVIVATLEAVAKRASPSARGGWVMKDRREQLDAMRAHYRRRREPQRQMPQVAPEGAGENSDDVLANVAQIRPERQGGAAVGTRAEMNRHTTEHRPAAKGAMEDDFYRALVTSGTRVHIRCRDGYELPEAIVKDFGTFSILVEADDGEELLFKHAVISIRPLNPETPG